MKKLVKNSLISLCFTLVCILIIANSSFALTNTPAGDIIESRIFWAGDSMTMKSNINTTQTVDSNFGGVFITVSTDKVVDILTYIYLTNTLQNFGNHDDTFNLSLLTFRTSAGVFGGYSYRFEALDGTPITSVGPVARFGSTNFRVRFYITNAGNNEYVEFLIGAQAEDGANVTAIAYTGDNSVPYGGDIGVFSPPGFVSPNTNGYVPNQDDGFIRLTIISEPPIMTNFITYQRQDNSGQAIIKFTGVDYQDNNCDYVYTNCEYSTNGISWFDMTTNTLDSSNSATPLAFQTTGSNFIFVWNAAADVNYEGLVFVRMQVEDTDLNRSRIYTNNFNIDTILPFGGTLQLSDSSSGDTNYTTSTNIDVVITNETGANFYLIAENQSSAPAYDDARWLAAKPTDFDLSTNQGLHTVYVWLKDSYNNVSVSSFTDFILLDTIVPPVPTLISLASNALTNDNTPDFLWNSVSDVNGISRYDIEIDTVVYDASTDTNYTSGVLSDGTYNWRVRAIDNAGNIGNWTTLWDFTIDTNAPAMPARISLASNALTNDNTPDFLWNSVSDASGISRYDIEIDTVVYDASTDTNYTSGALSDGTYNWRVRAVDTAGNIGNWTTLWDFTVDTNAPAITTLISPLSNALTTNNTPEFVWNRVTDINGISGYDIEINSVISNLVNVSNYISGTLTNGSYSWRIRAIDNAGNIGNWATPWLVIVNTNTPDMSIVKFVSNVKLNGIPSNNVPGATITYQINYTNIGGVDVNNFVLYDKLGTNVVYLTNYGVAGLTVQFSTNNNPDQAYNSTDYSNSYSMMTNFEWCQNLQWIRWRKATVPNNENESLTYKVIIK